MTAKPLFEIMRAMINEYLKPSEARGLTEAECNTFSGVLTQISKEYRDLYETRNNLLHGTWFIGYEGPDTDSSEFHIHRYVVSKDGLSIPGELPKNAAQLLTLTDRCNEARAKIATVNACLPISKADLKIRDCFRHDGNEWVCAWPSLRTLPPKHG